MTKIESEFMLESVPEDLHSSILEKLTYTELVSLEKCSSFSKKMAQNLPKSVKLPFECEKIILQGPNENEIKANFTVMEKKFSIPFEKIPTNVRITVKEFCCFVHYGFDFLFKLSITANHLRFNGGMEEDLIRKLINHVKPTELNVDSYDESGERVLALEEVKMMKTLNSCLFGTPDDLVLNLNASTLHIGGFDFISKEGVIKFLKQWKDGDRKIERVSWHMGSRFLEIRWGSLFEDISCTTDPRGHIFCRSEDHSDCIHVEEDYSEFLHGFLVITAVENCVNRQLKK